MSFQRPNAPVKPTIAAIGYLATLGEAKESKSGSGYTVIPYELKGKFGSMDSKGNVTLLPEWLNPAFNILNLEDAERADLSVYRMNVAGPDSTTMAVLEGLSGSYENFEELDKRRRLLTEYTPETVEQLLTDFFKDLGPVEIGYILRQKYDKVEDEVSGEVYKHATNFYEIGSWYYPTVRTIEALIKREMKSRDAEEKAKADGKKPARAPFRVGFDLKAAGIEVQTSGA